MGVWWIGSWEGPGWMTGMTSSGKDAELAVQASTWACSAGPWNSCKT